MLINLDVVSCGVTRVTIWANIGRGEIPNQRKRILVRNPSAFDTITYRRFNTGREDDSGPGLQIKLLVSNDL